MAHKLHIALLLATAFLGACRSESPDVIFHGGVVLTVNSHDEVVQALAMRDGLITSVGSDAQVMETKGPNTELVDLRGRTVMPGFVGAHEHPSITAVFSGAANLSGFTHRTNAEVWQALRDAVAKAPKGEWIYAGGLDPILTPDLKIPNRRELDVLAPENPVVMVSQTFHSFWANSSAFAAAGITRDTPDPGTGAYYERDAQGELTGFVAEARAAAPLIKGLKSPLKIYWRYVTVLDDLVANGFTSVASMGFNVPPLFARVAASRNFSPRIRQFFYLAEEELGYLPETPDTDDPYFRVLGVKLFHDGSPYTGSMFTSVPYLDSPLARTLGIPPGSRGAAMITQDALVETLKKYAQRGWQIAIHSQGDSSNRAVVQAIETAGALPGAKPVVRLEHGVFMPLDSVGRLAQLGTTASFHIHHIKYYGNALADGIVGLKAAMQILPVQTAFSQGIQPTLHADSPMYPAQGFALMQTAINRKSNQGLVLNGGQGITSRQALRTMTIHGAYQLRLQKQTGSLEAGKWADLQIVDRNPYETPAGELDKTRIEAVYVGGRRQYGAP